MLELAVDASQQTRGRILSVLTEGTSKMRGYPARVVALEKRQRRMSPLVTISNWHRVVEKMLFLKEDRGENVNIEGRDESPALWSILKEVEEREKRRKYR